MKIGKIVTGGMFVGLIVLSNIISIPVKATPLEPEWMSGSIAHDTLNRDTLPVSQCISENRRIKPANFRVYDNINPEGSERVCVYKSRGFQYAYYQRGFLINPTMPSAGIIYEKGVAFASDDVSDMTPSKFEGTNLDRLYTGEDSDVFVQQERNANYALTLRLYRDPLSHMYVDSDGFLRYTPGDNGYFYLRNEQGGELSVEAGSVSGNGKYLAVTMAGYGLGVISLDDGTTHLLNDQFNVSNTYPRPSPFISVNANGSVFVIGGANVETRVYKLTAKCGIFFRDTVPSSKDGYSTCVSRNLTGLTQEIGAANNRNGYPEMINITLSDRGDSFTYTDNIDWYMIFASNYIAADAMNYLALGDSYSSGEGDIDETGSSHYLPFTNVSGNYPAGVPRELCHLSDRSYPFLLANDMQLRRGNDMQSIACSGAKRNDVLTGGALDTGNLTYLGQPTPLMDLTFLNKYSAPRLGGLSRTDANALQDEAIEKFIPGRVQQIEMVRKYKPKVATIGVSGNDVDFAPMLIQCIKDLVGDCTYSKPEGLADLGEMIKDNYGYQLSFYQALKNASPGTDFYAVGYPQFISNNTAFCAEIAGTLSLNERTMIRSAVTYLNQTIRNAASKAGIKYIDIENVISDKGEELCSQSGMITGPVDKFYYGGLTAMYRDFQVVPTKYNESALERYILTGASGEFLTAAISPMTTLLVFMQEAFHPNAVGHQAIYDYIHAHQNGTSLLDDECDDSVIICPTDTNSYEPSTPAFFGQTDANIAATNLLRVDTSSGKQYLQIAGVSEVERGKSLDVYMQNTAYTLGTTLSVELHSEPVLLASPTSGAGGEVSASITIPEGTPVGYHQLTVTGIGVDGRTMKYIESVFVTGPSDDIDGDGVKNTVDSCQFIAPSGSDIDRDGIDDNCDLNVAAITSAVTAMGALAVSEPVQEDDDGDLIMWPDQVIVKSDNLLGNIKLDDQQTNVDTDDKVGIRIEIGLALALLLCLILIYATIRNRMK